MGSSSSKSFLSFVPPPEPVVPSEGAPSPRLGPIGPRRGRQACRVMTRDYDNRSQMPSSGPTPLHSLSPHPRRFSLLPPPPRNHPPTPPRPSGPQGARFRLLDVLEAPFRAKRPSSLLQRGGRAGGGGGGGVEAEERGIRRARALYSYFIHTLWLLGYARRVHPGDASPYPPGANSRVRVAAGTLEGGRAGVGRDRSARAEGDDAPDGSGSNVAGFEAPPKRGIKFPGVHLGRVSLKGLITPGHNARNGELGGEGVRSRPLVPADG